MAQHTDQEAALKIASGRKAFVEPLRLGERLKEIRLERSFIIEF